MYKIKIISGIATEKSVGCYLNTDEYEITSGQFIAVQLPCQATISGGEVVLGNPVDYTQIPQTPDIIGVATEGDIRKQRDKLLAASDYTQMGDSPLTDDCKLAFASYRQSLRDITAQTGFPTEISWPESPETINK